MRNHRCFFICYLLLFILTGCTPRESAPAESTEEAILAELTFPEETQPPAETFVTEAPTVPEPEAPAPMVPIAEPSGTAAITCPDAVIDYSHAEEGYVMVRYTGSSDKRLKVLVKGPSTTYSYNLPKDTWNVFPLSDGNGNYQVGIYINVDLDRYAQVLSTEFTAELTDEFAPFLRPNQYVDYAASSRTVALGLEITKGIQAPLEKVAAIYDYVVTHLTYDEQKARSVQSGYLPVLDEVMARGTGICFDYAAVMTAMLRSQGIPCKLVVGYAGSVYHAWISVWTEESGWIDRAIFFDGHVWHRMDPTFASSADRSDDIMKFIQNGTYTTKYLY